MSTAHSMSDAERIAYLEGMVQKLQAQRNGKLTLKVSEKGGLSVYGMGKFPITHYASQWERILENAEQIKAFIAANESTLARKG